MEINTFESVPSPALLLRSEVYTVTNISFLTPALCFCSIDSDFSTLETLTGSCLIGFSDLPPVEAFTESSFTISDVTTTEY